MTITEKHGEFTISTGDRERYDKPRMQHLAAFDPKPVAWLWTDRIPLGKVTLIEGDEASGKSFVVLDLVARASCGAAWPDGPPGFQPDHDAILVCDADNLEDTVMPRLEAASANTHQITLYSGATTFEPLTSKNGERRWEFPLDLPQLEYVTRNVQARLVVIDPLSDFCPQEKQIPGTLRKLEKLAQETGAAIVVTARATTRRDAAGKWKIGSRPCFAGVRCAWFVAQDPENESRRLLLPTRLSFCREPEGIAFQVQDARVEWETVPAESPDSPSRQLSDVECWLNEALSQEAQMPAKVLQKEAAGFGFSKKMLWRARLRLGVDTHKDGFGYLGSWWWSLKKANAAKNPVEPPNGQPEPTPGSVPPPGDPGGRTDLPNTATNDPPRPTVPPPFSFERLRRAVVLDILMDGAADPRPDFGDPCSEFHPPSPKPKRSRKKRQPGNHRES